MRPAVAVVSSLLIVCGANAAAAVPCPLNSLTVHDSTQASSAPSGQLSASHFCPPYGGTAQASAAYDLPAGSFVISASGASECGGGASLATHDVFTVVGPVAGAVLAFHALLQVNASFAGRDLSSTAEANAALREGASNGQGFNTSPGQPMSALLDVAITRTVGGTFDLYVDLDAYALGLSSGASISGQLGFAGLPAGYAVASCQGFASDPAVAVRRASWGRLKTIYR